MVSEGVAQSIAQYLVRFGERPEVALAKMRQDPEQLTDEELEVIDAVMTARLLFIF